MQNRCPFLMGHTCYGGGCMMWRLSLAGEGYCGVAGAPVDLSAKLSPTFGSPSMDAPLIALDKKTTNGAMPPRQKR